MNLEEPRVPRIHAPEIRTNPDHYLRLAKEALKKKDNQKAIENYIKHAENLNHPNDMRLDEQAKLTKMIINLSTQLTGDESSEEIFGILNPYLAVLNLYPENALLLNTIGVLFFTRGEYTTARQFLQRAASIGYLPGEKNYLHVIWNLVPRWHFRMLNDKHRNEAYRKAITKAVTAGFTDVYDIGSGCGLLSLIAAKTRPDVRVTAFEEVKVLCDISIDIFKINNVKNITLCNRNSNLVPIAPQPCNLVVTEIFDAAVFGEGCLRTIKNAIQCFVTQEKFKIIPASVKLYVTGFRSVDLSKKHRYIGQLEELNLSACIKDNDPGSYDAQYLNNRDVQYMTNTVIFLTTDFYDVAVMESILNPGCDPHGSCKLVCTESGTMDALAVWFDLHLDEEITISTHPNNADNSCWEQAVFHLPHPITVKTGEIIHLEHSLAGGQTSFRLNSHNVECPRCFHVSTEIVTFLNDQNLVASIKQAASTFGKEQCNLKILDFNIFPLFGFLMAKKGAVVYHVYQEEHDLHLFSKIVEDNNIPASKFIFINRKLLEQYMVYLEAPDIVFTNHVRTDGSWNKEEFTLDTELKLNCESMPKKILLKAQLINSSYLDTCNKVDDNNALNFRIFEHINKLTGNEHPNLESFEYDRHSTVVTFDITDIEIMDLHVEGDIIMDGTCNAILYWFEMQFTDDESNTFSTLESTHFDKCCTLLNSPKSVEVGESLMFHMLRQEGHLKVYCDQSIIIIKKNENDDQKIL